MAVFGSFLGENGHFFMGQTGKIYFFTIYNDFMAFRGVFGAFLIPPPQNYPSQTLCSIILYDLNVLQRFNFQICRDYISPPPSQQQSPSPSRERNDRNVYYSLDRNSFKNFKRRHTAIGDISMANSRITSADIDFNYHPPTLQE